jgi:sulfite reductase (NADPH) hemoprotein beta-component
VIGPSFAAADVPDVIERLVQTYLENRYEDEQFVDTVDRLGIEPFKLSVYSEKAHAKVAAHA